MNSIRTICLGALTILLAAAAAIAQPARPWNSTATTT